MASVYSVYSILPGYQRLEQLCMSCMLSAGAVFEELPASACLCIAMCKCIITRSGMFWASFCAHVYMVLPHLGGECCLLPGGLWQGEATYICRPKRRRHQHTRIAPSGPSRMTMSLLSSQRSARRLSSRRKMTTLPSPSVRSCAHLAECQSCRSPSPTPLPLPPPLPPLFLN